jgi:carbon-monoxide dehydrogenase medium subunit
MRLAELRYHTPDSLEAAWGLLESLPSSARLIAGGTDLLADLKQGKLGAGHLVALAGVPGMREIAKDGRELVLGALVTPNRLARSPEVRETIPALADAAGVMGGNQIRNLATLGGNLASAVPSADLPPALIAGRAEVRLVSAAGERRVPVAELFTGPRTTVIGRAEILASVHLSLPPPASGSAYTKFQLRDASALSVVGVAASLTLGAGRIAAAAVAVGAAAPVPLAVPAAGEWLAGKEPTEEVFHRAGEIAAAAVSPIDDIRGSSEYRRSLTAVLTVRSLRRALERATGNGRQA